MIDTICIEISSLRIQKIKEFILKFFLWFLFFIIIELPLKFTSFILIHYFQFIMIQAESFTESVECFNLGFIATWRFKVF